MRRLRLISNKLFYRKTLLYSSEGILKSRSDSKDEDDDEDDCDRLDVVGLDDSHISTPGILPSFMFEITYFIVTSLELVDNVEQIE